MSHRDYLALVPSDHGHYLRVSGPVGARPDLRILRNGYGIGGEAPYYYDCWRMRLHKSIERLTFTFSRPDGSNYKAASNNFCHMREFFVVTEKIKEFLIERSGADFDAFPVNVVNQDTGPLSEKYWAMKCTTRIDCIDDEKSVAFQGRYNDRKIVSLKDTVQELELSDEMIYEYANYNGNRQRLYTQWQVQHIFMDSSRIISGLKIFEPQFLPSVLIVQRDFAKELKRLCHGDCFWALELTDLNGQRSEQFIAMR